MPPSSRTRFDPGRCSVAATPLDAWDPGCMSAPPDGLPSYRVLTGPDDAAFCHRVSEAIALGYRLHGGPALTYDGKQVIVAQAMLWPGASEFSAD